MSGRRTRHPLADVDSIKASVMEIAADVRSALTTLDAFVDTLDVRSNGRHAEPSDTDDGDWHEGLGL